MSDDVWLTYGLVLRFCPHRTDGLVLVQKAEVAATQVTYTNVVFLLKIDLITTIGASVLKYEDTPSKPSICLLVHYSESFSECSW